MLLFFAVRSLAGVLVNEVVYDVSTTDAGNEWIELCNNGTETIDLTGWTVESGGSSFGTSFSITSGTIAPGEYVVIGGPSTTHPGTFSPELQNGGSETDGIRVLDSTGTVMDTVLYDTPNDNVLADDLGLSTSTPAVDVSEDQSLARWPDCTDSDVSGDDFDMYDVPSPGSANPEVLAADTGDTGSIPEDSADCSLIDWVKINEFLADPAGDDVGNEWVELHNSSGTDADVSGWIFRWDSSDFGTASDFEIPSGTMIAAGGFLVLGSGGTAVELDLGNATSSSDGMQLACSDLVVDTVIYGDPNSDGFPDDNGTVATSVAPPPASGIATARYIDGIDTDLSGDDFTYASANTPGAANQVPQCDPTGGEWLKVNEVLFDPNEDDATYEFIEIYNAGSDTIYLEGFVIEAAKSSWAANATLESGMMLAPGEFFVIGGGDVVEQDYSASDLDLGNGTDGDGVRIVDCDGVVLDSVLYGDELSDSIEGDAGATDVVPNPGGGSSIGRYEDGDDANLATDWYAYEVPSPGAPNAEPEIVEPPACDPAGGEGLKVNEVLFDPDDADATYEFVEIYNAGSETVSLEGFVLEAAKGSWDENATLPAGITLAPGDFYVIGGGDVPEQDYSASGLDLGNGTDGDGVRLLDCAGLVLDTVLYGDELSDDIEGDGGATDVVPNPGGGSSIGRYQDGDDANLATDWYGYEIPSPGAPNDEPEIIEPPACDPTGGEALKVNEVQFDPAEDDGTYEFVELFNAGSVEINLEGFVIEGAKSSWDENAVLPKGESIAPGEFYVVGGGDATNQDYDASDLDLGNGTDGDGVRVLDCAGVVLDSVLYGDELADEIEGDNGATGVVENPGSGSSIGRFPDGADADMHTDWFPYDAPSPGGPNADPGAEDSGDTNNNGDDTGGKEIGGGCGPTPERPDGAECSAVPLPLGGLEILVASVVAMRGRRRK